MLLLIYVGVTLQWRAFQPFVFLNLRGGTSQRTAKSLGNPAEAALAVNVYQSLIEVGGAALSGKTAVVIAESTVTSSRYLCYIACKVLISFD